MKKVLSMILGLAMLLSLMTFAQSPVSADAHGAYTPADISGVVNSKAYLSTTTAGTITDDGLSWHDFFYRSPVSTPRYAISKESIDAQLTNGVLTWNGIPFNVQTLDNQNSVIACTNDRIPIPLGYYSKFYFLCASPDNFYTGSSYASGENIYRTMYGPNSATGSVNWLSTDAVCDLQFAKVKSDDVLSGNPKLMVRSYEILDKTKMYNEISTWIDGTFSTRILAVTVEGLKGNEWNTIIEAKIAALPESFSDVDITAFTELVNMVDSAEATGGNVSGVTGIDKYLSFKAIYDNMYKTIDISGMLNSKAFLSTSTAGTVTDGEAVWPHFFIKSISAGVSTAPYAISKESIDSKLTNGSLYWNGIPFNVVTLDNQNSVLGTTNSKVQIPVGYYSKFYFLCASPDNFYTGSNYTSGENIYRNIYTPDGTRKSTDWLSTDLVCDLDFAKVKADDVLSGHPKLMVRSYDVMDKTQAYNKISVGIEGNYSTRVLAVTVAELMGDEWDAVIEPKLAALPASISDPGFDAAAFDELTALLEKAETNGADTASMNDIDKYYALKAQLSEPQITMSDAKKAANGDNAIYYMIGVSLNDAEATALTVKHYPSDKDVSVAQVRSFDITKIYGAGSVFFGSALRGIPNDQLDREITTAAVLDYTLDNVADTKGVEKSASFNTAE